MARRCRSRRATAPSDPSAGDPAAPSDLGVGGPAAEARTVEAREAAAPGARRRRAPKLLGLIFIAAGVNHFAMPRPYRRIVPPGWGDPGTLVTVSGVAEIAGGLGVLLSPTRRLAGLGLVALLAAVFPANLHMARNPHEFHRIPRWALYARLPLQPLMMWWVLRATRATPPDRAAA